VRHVNARLLAVIEETVVIDERDEEADTARAWKLPSDIGIAKAILLPISRRGRAERRVTGYIPNGSRRW